ncbi:hemerythrin domain-containing protein [Yinghuangia aomiensis]
MLSSSRTGRHSRTYTRRNPRPPTGPCPRDALGIVHELTAEHREIERWLTALQQASELRARTQLARKLTGRMDRHLDVAETCLNPAVREHVTGGVGPVVKGRHGRDEIAVRIDELRMLDPDDERYPGVPARLRLGVSAHIRDEEDRVLVRLRGACTRAQFVALADRARGTSLAGRS